jgi:hypothetical protein
VRKGRDAVLSPGGAALSTPPASAVSSYCSSESRWVEAVRNMAKGWFVFFLRVKTAVDVDRGLGNEEAAGLARKRRGLAQWQSPHPARE